MRKIKPGSVKELASVIFPYFIRPTQGDHSKDEEEVALNAVFVMISFANDIFGYVIPLILSVPLSLPPPFILAFSLFSILTSHTAPG